ncbi:MAG TPA: glucan 1,4-alpha-maltotetraohydrolase domain-containing protein, partial [Gemmataceae bacterium]|nr:glucan 1,4-alpha-maltotetraohydrolase domain-containing protein [Gemmataceae bacterium]
DWGPETRHHLEQLIRVRKSAGLRSRSTVDIHEASNGLYAATIDGRVAMKLGRRDWWPGPGWKLAVDGERFAVWLRTS